MDVIIDTLRADWQVFLSFAPRLLYAVIVVATAFFIGRQIGRLTSRLVNFSGQLRVAGMTFSTDVTAGIVIVSAPELKLRISDHDADTR